MEKALNEIDQELLNLPNQPSERLNYTTPAKRKSFASPLILAPPVIKSFEEKNAADVEIKEEPILTENELESFESSDQDLYYDENSSGHDTKYNEESPESYTESSELFYGEEAESPEMLYNYEESIEKESIKENFGEREEESREEFLTAKDVEKGHLKDIWHTSAPRVKIPIHLSTANLEIDVFDTLNLSRPIYSVSKIDWLLYSIEAEVLLPSSKVYAKGVFILDIEYVSSNIGTVHSLKIYLPWRKVMPVEWLHLPEISGKKSNEYMFMNNEGNDLHFHREYKESLVEKIDFNLKSFKCIWNEQIINKNKLLIQGTANAEIDIYQKQCLSLSRLLNYIH